MTAFEANLPGGPKPGADDDPAETRRVARVDRRGCATIADPNAPSPSSTNSNCGSATRASSALQPPYSAYRNTIPLEKQGALSRRPRARAAPDLDHALERARHGRARQSRLWRARRPYRQLRLRRGNLRDRLPAFFSRLGRRRRRRSRLSSSPIRRPASTPAPFSKGASSEDAARALSSGGRRRRALVLPASLADAGLLAISDRLDGARRHQRHLSGALHALSRKSRPRWTGDRRVWGVYGDGELDEPESTAALTLAAREKLDNLTFVINCNLQRLDGPVRGNGQIIQELEALFTGAGWNVIKVLWGSEWDALFARDKTHVLLRRFAETVDGEYQNLGAHDGDYNRAKFFDARSGFERAGRDHDRRRDQRAEARRPRLPQALRRLRGGAGARGPPDGDPRQDQEGLRHGRGGRVAHDRPSVEEARRRGADGVP